MISPDTIAALQTLGISDEKMYELRRQLQQAQAMRFQQAPQARQAGRVSIAANPLEMLATGVNRFRGGRQAQRISGDIEGEMEKIKAAKGALQRQILMMQQMGGQQPQGPAQRRQQFYRQYAPPETYSA